MDINDLPIINLTEHFLKETLRNNKNLILFGKHGTSKSTQIMNVLNSECSDNWAYFSASTLDPWTDLIGVPKPKIDENGNEILTFIRPPRINSDLEVIVVDEFNRAPKKVLNALHELVQFKTLNGMKFKNLRCVWACGNPDNETTQNYTVEKVDDALLDKFEVRVRVSEQPSEEYFSNKYGVEVTRNALSWYKNLSEDVYISPRRLDIALDSYLNGGISMIFTLPTSSNPKNLQYSLMKKSLESILSEGINISSILQDAFYAAQFIKAFSNGDEKFVTKYVKYLFHCPHEMVSSMFSDVESVTNIFTKRDRNEVLLYTEIVVYEIKVGDKEWNKTNIKESLNSNLYKMYKLAALKSPRTISKIYAGNG